MSGPTIGNWNKFDANVFKSISGVPDENTQRTTRTANGQGTDTPRTCYGLATGYIRTPNGRATDRLRTAHGLADGYTHTPSPPRSAKPSAAVPPDKGRNLSKCRV